MTIYYPGNPIQPGAFPAILAIGDSWFWYPKRANLLESLTRHRKLKPEFANIQVLGYNGAKLHEYTTGRYAKQLKEQLAPKNALYFSGVMISGAGNDALDYRLALKADCSSKTSAADCIDEDAMRSFCGDISRDLGGLIHDIWWAFNALNRAAPIFIHSYDYPIPDGRGFKLAGLSVKGPWLKPAMDARHVPSDPELRKEICKLLIDRISTTFKNFENDATGVRFVDSRGTLRRDAQYRSDWDNEMHPTASGFDAIIEQHWIPALQAVGWANL